MFVSDYLGLDFELETRNVFDSMIDKDSHFFINLIRLRSTQTPEFKNSYQRIIVYFNGIAMLLEASESKNIKDPFYREALKRFSFGEVNGVNLGFSTTRYGAGFGLGLRNQVIADAFDIVKKGSKQPEIFQLVGLFVENVGPDRLSDMIATIIQPDIITYTKRILAEFSITQETYLEYQFKDGLLQNPYKKNCPILLLPMEILHELPIARCWDDIDRVISDNENIRREINAEIGAEWHKWASGQKKAYIKEHIFKNPERCARLIEGYRSTEIGSFDLTSDFDYLIEMLWRKITKLELSFSISGNCAPDSKQAALKILDIFKDWVENNKGWYVITSVESVKREKIVQRLVHLCAKEYIKQNNQDISFEPDAGRGPVDFKLSRGNDKTITEIKLSSNSQYLHGYQEQVQEYGKAENTDQLIYAFVDVGNPRRLRTIVEAQQINVSMGTPVPDLVIISAVEKIAASTYTS